MKSASVWNVCGTAGRIFTITVPRFALSPMSLLTVGLSIDVAGRWQCTLSPTAAADQVPHSTVPAARQLMSVLYTCDARNAVATCCVDT